MKRVAGIFFAVFSVAAFAAAGSLPKPISLVQRQRLEVRQHASLKTPRRGVPSRDQTKTLLDQERPYHPNRSVEIK
jgi:hypothetical protein